MKIEQLVELAQAGNAAALDRLLEELRPRLVGWALGLFRSYDAAQDVVQEAMAKVVTNLRQLAHPAAFISWAYTILKRCGIEFFRRQTKCLPDGVSLDDPAVGASSGARAALRGRPKLIGQRFGYSSGPSTTRSGF